MNSPQSDSWLTEPDIAMAREYRRFLQEFIDAGEVGVIHSVPSEIGDVEDCILRLQNHREGIDLPDEWVPCSAYWLVSGEGGLLGEIHIRHRLTPHLEEYGGHIGYMIRPGERRKGYATRLLALGLDKARELGLTRVLLMCDRENPGSARVIEKNGGVLEEEVPGGAGRVTLRYWITLPRSAA